MPARSFRWLSLLLLAVAMPGPPALPQADEPREPALRAAIERALPQVQHSAGVYVERSRCFACHHQMLPYLALSLAAGRGFDVDTAELRRQAEFTLASLAGGVEVYREGRGQGGASTTAGYALWALELAGHAPDATTEAVTGFLLRRDAGLPHWRPSARRPPSEGSLFTTTYVALRGLRAYAAPDQREAHRERRERALAWLLETRPAETEDRVFRLRALALAGAEPDAVRAAARELAETRLPNGGWAQTDGAEADAYATGSALVALAEVGGLATTDPIYRAGAAFLLRAQQEDGSWHVVSRSTPIQPFVETEFPHGKDQFISIAGTCWAVAALALALPADG